MLATAPGSRHVLTLKGRSYTPPALPGGRVTYRIKAAFNESRWSNRVAITYPRVGEEGGVPRVEEPPPRKERPRKEEPGVGERPVNYRLDAKSYADSIELSWFSRFARIMAYPTSGDRYAGAGYPTIAYHDAFTQWGTNGLTPSRRAEYVAKVQHDQSIGYVGTFMDDIEWASGYHQAGSEEEVAKLVEAVRAGLGPGAVLELNTQWTDLWPRMKSGDPFVARALAVTNMVDKEFGVSSSSGINTAAEYAEFFAYVDALHAKGIHVDLSSSEPGDEYSVATYQLFNDGQDNLGTVVTPSTWWDGFEANLGSAVGPRERLPKGIWTRRFTGGVVYTVEPGAPTQTITLSKTMHSARWGDVNSLTLAAGQGAVLVG
jgi:hypothetical protein